MPSVPFLLCLCGKGLIELCHYVKALSVIDSCVLLFIRVCVRVCVCACVCAGMCVCLGVFVCVHACVRACVCLCRHVLVFGCVCVCRDFLFSAYSHAPLPPSLSQTHTHIFTHTAILPLSIHVS